MPIKQQIRQFLDKYPQVKYVAVGLIAFLCGLLVGRCGSGNHSLTYHKLSVNEVLDSFVTVMPQGSQMVARFTDDRHALYYLNSGHLMKLNAAFKCNLTDVDIRKVSGSRLGWYRRAGMRSANFLLSPKVLSLSNKKENRPGLVDPLAYYLRNT